MNNPGARKVMCMESEQVNYLSRLSQNIVMRVGSQRDERIDD